MAKYLVFYSLGGDVVRVKLPKSYETAHLLGSSHSAGRSVAAGAGAKYTIEAKRVGGICKLYSEQCALSVLSQHEQVAIVVGEDGVVCSYDLESH